MKIEFAKVGNRLVGIGHITIIDVHHAGHDADVMFDDGREIHIGYEELKDLMKAIGIAEVKE